MIEVNPHDTAPLAFRSWVPILENEFRKPYFSKLDAFLEREASSKKIFPPRELIFSAFNACDFEDIKVTSTDILTLI